MTPLTGSGKFGTPCERMHAENLSSFALALAGGPPTPGPPPPAGAVALALAVTEPTWATPGLELLPPQPATSSTAKSNATAVGRASRALCRRVEPDALKLVGTVFMSSP
jgi:hypothetical protein